MPRLVLIVLVFLLALPASAGAQDRPRPEPSLRERIAQMPLDDLFARLAVSPERTSAKALENEILRRWYDSGSPTTDLLFGRALQALKDDDQGLALDILDRVVTLRPAFAEGWNKRATLHFARDEYGMAMSDLERVLALEPRHFGALAGLGVILQQFDRKEEALKVFDRALAINPQMEEVKKVRDELEKELAGRSL
ncbi:tetratricopeptide repeat protein [Propylenella binzhouense]|uniref:Tetratricopeptide repeat protein n=1 Tax=Propylenella binzhouense TaxID=2555902 RepID=A0A964T4H6_9HYPH|nr:tetratricopeptide repeat protein [Propylenella binzhouense]MYZ48298.1 hypothetical protein [Propylenella binzhouense]